MVALILCETIMSFVQSFQFEPECKIGERLQSFHPHYQLTQNNDDQRGDEAGVGQNRWCLHADANRE